MTKENQRRYRDWLESQRDFFNQAISDLELLEEIDAVYGGYGQRAHDDPKVVLKVRAKLNDRFDFDDSE